MRYSRPFPPIIATAASSSSQWAGISACLSPLFGSRTGGGKSRAGLSWFFYDRARPASLGSAYSTLDDPGTCSSPSSATNNSHSGYSSSSHFHFTAFNGNRPSPHLASFGSSSWDSSPCPATAYLSYSFSTGSPPSDSPRTDLKLLRPWAQCYPVQGPPTCPCRSRSTLTATASTPCCRPDSLSGSCLTFGIYSRRAYWTLGRMRFGESLSPLGLLQTLWCSWLKRSTPVDFDRNCPGSYRECD